MSLGRLNGRTELLSELDRQRRELERSATSSRYDRHRQSAISLLASPEVRHAFDVTRADDRTQDRYGRNSFGWSLLMALPAGRGRRQPGPGQPRQQRDLGHARRHLPPDEEQAAPADRPRLVRLLDDLKSAGLARQHADRDGERVRPDAEALDAAGIVPRGRPRPLGGGAERLLRRRRRPGRHGRRLVRQDRRLPRRHRRRRPRTWRPRSTTPSASPRPPPGTTSSTARTRSTTVSRFRSALAC